MSLTKLTSAFTQTMLTAGFGADRQSSAVSLCHCQGNTGIADAECAKTS